MAKIENDISLKTALGLTALLVFITFLVYSPARYNTLTNWDDKNYITMNQDITKHDKDFVKKSFSIPQGFVMGNYHPLTMLSYAWEYSSGGLNPMPFHTHNILLHLMNVALVFLFVLLLTQKRLAAFISACFFALHPMHVESVAWVSERKDLLFVLFSLLSMVFYVQYVRENKLYMYVLAILCFILALLGKAMAVSEALILFLIDYYIKQEVPLKRILFEKAPFILIAVVFGIIAIKAQQSIHSITINDYSFYHRILFASYACFTYLLKSIVPYSLNTYYDYPNEGTYSYYIVYMIALILLVVLLYKKCKENRLIVFSSLYFLVSIIQVLQLLPVGNAIVAERYTYMPYIGLFLAPSVMLGNLYFSKKQSIRLIAFPVLFIVLVNFSFQTHKRCFVWKDTVTIWTDALDKKPDIIKGLGGRGDAYNDKGQYRLAINDFDAALRLNDDFTDAYYNRGISEYNIGKQLQDSGKAKEATEYFIRAIQDNSKAIELNPNLNLAYFNGAGYYFTMGQYDKALSYALKAKNMGMNVDPKFIEVLNMNRK